MLSLIAQKLRAGHSLFAINKSENHRLRGRVSGISFRCIHGGNLNKITKQLKIRLTGSAIAQKLLERNLITSLKYMGIGSGDSPESSGEIALADLLKLQYKKNKNPLCIFDVGANKGQFLSLIENNIKSIPFQIHAFEPSLSTFKILSDMANNYTNVTLNQIGLGSLVGKSELNYNEADSEIASLYKRKLDHLGIDFSLSETIKIDTVDHYCANNNINNIDLLKIDTEGHELEVLKGASNMLVKKKIKFITFEFGGCNIDSRTYFKDFYYYFNENGMESMFRITPSGYLTPILQYKEIYEQFRTTNFLVVLKNE